MANLRLTCILILAVIGVLTPTTHASIITLPGIESITVWEDTRVVVSDPLNEVVLSISDNRLSTRLATLDGANHDFAVFRGGFDEFYDFFLSDADGTLDPLGDFLTIEARYNPPISSSNGGNISAVTLNFVGGQTEFADSVASFAVFGSGLADSVGNAVDGDLDTTTFLGNTLTTDQRLRLTVGFSSSTTVPEPSSLLIFGGSFAMLFLRRRRK